MKSRASRSAYAHWERHLGRAVDAEALRRDLTAGTIGSVASATARRTPDREAVRVGDEGMTHGGLDDRSRRLAAWLQTHGAGAGRCVLLAGPNSLAYVVGYLAALHAGAPVAFANPALTPAELATLVDAAQPAVALASSDRVEQFRDHGCDAALLTLDGLGEGTVAAAVAQSRPITGEHADPQTVAHLAYTSGTTGRPKQVPLSHANVLASIRAAMWSWRWRDDDVLVHALPLQHAHGLTGIHTALIAGSRVVVLPRFEPDALCRTVRDERATVMFAVPTIHERLLGWDALEPSDLATLRLATSGSAALSPRTSDAMAEVLGHRPLERYGCTETGYVVSNPYEGERRAGAVGFALPGAEVEVVDERGGVVPSGAEGELVTRGPQVFAGYGGVGPEANVFWPGGWFRTGDLARMDGEGVMSITGRLKELIITGGLNVSPREVELALEALAPVAEAAVVGRPSARWGEEVTAFVVLRPGVPRDTAALAAQLEAVLAPYKRPKAFHVVDGLPRNHMGKLLRAELVERAVQLAPG
jgi:malonyl-CoA/methylmalonyl-CoA synthetase